jgi:hypothetical protein
MRLKTVGHPKTRWGGHDTSDAPTVGSGGFSRTFDTGSTGHYSRILTGQPPSDGSQA